MTVITEQRMGTPSPEASSPRPAYERLEDVEGLPLFRANFVERPLTPSEQWQRAQVHRVIDELTTATYESPAAADLIHDRFRNSGPRMPAFCDNVAGYGALEVVYVGRTPAEVLAEGLIGGDPSRPTISTQDFARAGQWQGDVIQTDGEAIIRHARTGYGTVERFMLAKHWMQEHMQQVSNQEYGERVFRFGSFGSGAFRLPIEIMTEGPTLIEAYALDINPDALAYSKRLAEKFGVGDRVHTVRGSVTHASRALQRAQVGTGDRKLHVLEDIGVGDYFPDDQRYIQMLKQGSEVVGEGGIMVIANLATSRESAFLERVARWPRMEVREPERFARMLNRAQEEGLGAKDIEMAIVPSGVHVMAKLTF
jgi:predicted O-methyltransferase YrrM